MTVPVLSTQDSLEVIRTEIVFTLAALRPSTRASKYVAMMEPLLPEWAKVSAQELLLRDAKTTASAAITAASNQLNPCIDQVAALVLVRTKNKRTHDLYKRYFGSKRPSDLKRPALAEKVAVVRTWVPSLKGSPETELQALGATLEGVVALAGTANAAAVDAGRALLDFRQLGARKALVEKVNQVRKAVYGELSQVPHAEPSQHLPADWADQFFRHDSRDEATVASVTEEITRLQAELSAQQSLRQRLQAQADAEEQQRKEADQAEAAAALREVELEIAEAQKRASELRSRVVTK